MKKIVIALLVTLGCMGCEKDYFHDSGRANGKNDCSMWEFLQRDAGNWSLTVEAIRHAGLIDIFDGTNPVYKEITFFGVTDLSINQFLFKTVGQDGERIYKSVGDIPVELCRRMILSYVIPKKIMRAEVNFEIPGKLEGGTVEKTATGIDLRVFRRKSDYGSAQGEGATSLYIHATESGFISMNASGDNKVTNGVVHSLSYKFQWVEL